jgi:hypothetical protein
VVAHRGALLLQPYVQVIVVGVVQLPAPLQSAAVAATLFVHDAAAPHDTVLPG